MTGTDLKVSALAMGCARLGSWWQGRRDVDGRNALIEAMELGINLFDTSDSYGRGRSERLLGQAIKSVRPQMVVVTKCGLLKTPSSFDRAMRTVGKTRSPRMAGSKMSQILRERRCYSPPYIEASAEASLQRLGTDYIDIFLLHSPPAEVLRRGEFLDALERLRRQGKARHVGISARDSETARQAVDLAGVNCVQADVSVCRESAATLGQAALARGVGLLARRPFESGRGLEALDPAEREHTLRACLRYVLAVPGVGSVVTGMTRPGHVSANVAVLTDSVGAAESNLEVARRYICHG
ncbi:MAG TPA: aldo/keto reductase [Acidimicrobiia bacterium]|nr:aldo/keto reductase [Acidimicrobiia bacterium]